MKRRPHGTRRPLVATLAAATLLSLGGGIALQHRSAKAQAQDQVQDQAGAQVAMQAQTAAVAKATLALLDMLSPQQRQQVQFPFTPLKQGAAASFSRAGRGRQGGPPFMGERYGAAVWSNYPIGGVPRPGLQLSQMTPQQRDATMHVLQVLLSPMGLRKVQDIMAGDQAFEDQGHPYATGPGTFTLTILGTPSATAPWMFEFGAHHLGLNVVLDGAHAVMTPTLTGTEPAEYVKDGKHIRTLAAENDRAYALLDSLDPTQRAQAILKYKVDDLVLGPGHDGEAIVPEGLKGASMTPAQRALLLDLTWEWAGMLAEPYTRPRMQEIRDGLDQTWFAWSGPTTHQPDRNGAAYFRIQGPRVVIEFAPQATDGDLTQHVHTVYRNPMDEYGHLFTMR